MLNIKFNGIYMGDSISITGDKEEVDSKYKLDNYTLKNLDSIDTEIEMEKIVINYLIKNNKIDLILGGDLTNQLGITHESMSTYDIPFMGIFSACSSFTEELILGASMLKNRNVKKIISLVSSHNLNVERTFRYPIEYGFPQRNTQSFTATGSVGVILQKEESKIKLESCTVGRVTNYELKDVNNMGAIMAPAAAETLLDHLKYFKRNPNYYDIILTGDLGTIGSKLFLEIMKKNGINLKNHLDAGSNIIKNKYLSKVGASGPTCLPLMLVGKILKQKKYKKVLLIGTGALFNTTMVNNKKDLLSISHIVSLEVN